MKTETNYTRRTFITQEFISSQTQYNLQFTTSAKENIKINQENVFSDKLMKI